MVKINITRKTHSGVRSFRGRFSLFGNSFSFCMYYVEGLLIDTGPKRARRDIVKYIDEVQPKAILLTHYHEDHSGNAAFLSKRYGIPVYMSAATSEQLKKDWRLPPYRRLIWGTPEPVNGETVTPGLKLGDGRFDIIETPGHCSDHISLVSRNHKMLFSGDLYLNRKMHYGIKGESVPDLIASIDKVLKYPFEGLCCGHAGMIHEGKGALLDKRSFLLKLTEDSVQLAKKGLSEKQIARQLFPRRWVVENFSGGEMSAIHLVRSILDTFKH